MERDIFEVDARADRKSVDGDQHQLNLNAPEEINRGPGKIGELP
jgi:hypothetical protein